MLLHLHRKKHAINRGGLSIGGFAINYSNYTCRRCSIEKETRMKNLMSVGGNCQENS